jgi:hypothetical protein
MDYLRAMSQITQEANDLVDQVPCRPKLTSQHCLSEMQCIVRTQGATPEQ